MVMSCDRAQQHSGYDGPPAQKPPIGLIGLLILENQLYFTDVRPGYVHKVARSTVNANWATKHQYPGCFRRVSLFNALVVWRPGIGPPNRNAAQRNKCRLIIQTNLLRLAPCLVE